MKLLSVKNVTLSTALIGAVTLIATACDDGHYHSTHTHPVVHHHTIVHHHVIVHPAAPRRVVTRRVVSRPVIGVRRR